MAERTHDLTVLPQWAQKMIADMASTIEHQAHEYDQQSKAAAILHDHNHWHVIQGPCPAEVQGDPMVVRKLFFLSRDGADVAATLLPGDVLIVGRKKERGKMMSEILREHFAVETMKVRAMRR